MKKKCLVLGIVVMLILCVRVSYSYYVVEVNNKNENIRVSSKEINIIFTDKTEISESPISPGWSTSKTFSVKNNSDDVFNYNIVLEDLLNTFKTEGFLQYKITSSNGYNMSEYKDIPKSSSPKDVVLSYDIDIPSKELHEYTIEFIYLNSPDIDQSIDMGMELGGTLAIVEGSVDPSIKYAVTLIYPNGTIVGDNTKETVKNGTLNFEVNHSERYDIENAIVTCDNEAKIKLENNNVEVSDIKSNNTCTINTNIKRYTLTMNVKNGSVSPSNVVVDYDGTKEFTITAASGYSAVGMIVSCKNINGSLTNSKTSVSGSKVTISNIKEDQTCTATLKALPKVTLSVSNGSGGSTKQVTSIGGSLTFTGISANIGYTLSSTVSCTGTATGSISGSTVTISNINTEQTCTVNATKNTYAVKVSSNNINYGTIKQSATSVYYNGSVTITLSPKTGYQYASDTCGGTISGNTMTISNIKSPISCIVNFEINTDCKLYVTGNQDNDYVGRLAGDNAGLGFSIGKTYYPNMTCKNSNNVYVAPKYCGSPDLFGFWECKDMGGNKSWDCTVSINRIPTEKVCSGAWCYYPTGC